MNKPESIAESLYHEALHAKLVNTLDAYDLLKFDMLKYVKSFICPWTTNSKDKEWAFMRAIGAYHVYCHLLALHRLITLKKGIYEMWSNERIPTIREKLPILSEYINKSKSSGIFTELGKEYFDLLSKIGEM